MKKYSARKMLQSTAEELQQNLSGTFILVFDDGEMEVTASSTVISGYVWNFHRQWPNTPLLQRHHAQWYTKKQDFGGGTIIQLLKCVAWDVYDAYNGMPNQPSSTLLAKWVYETTNQIYNAMVVATEDSVISLDILDFIEVTDTPEVAEVLKAAPGLKVSRKTWSDWISRSYKAIEKFFMQRDNQNALAVAVRAGLVKKQQALQCVGPRGFVTDVDDVFFKYPITRSFLTGMKTIYNTVVESRSGARSLIANKQQISDAEYFARKLQLLVEVVERVHPGDCGSQKYLIMKVRDREIDADGIQVRPPDLEILQGKYYLNEETGKLEEIRADSTYLLNKMIRIRSPLAGCQHPNPNGICEVCMGALAKSVPPGTTLGHLAASYTTQQSSQGILSTKHFMDGNPKIQSIKLVGGDNNRCLKVSDTGNSYLFNDKIKSTAKCMIIPADALHALPSIEKMSLDEISRANVADISGIEGMSIVLESKTEQTIVPITLNIGNRKASLTYRMLQHIKQKGWTKDEYGNFVITLDGWNWEETAFIIPVRRISMGAFAKEIEKFIESPLGDKENMCTALIEFSDLINSRLNINIALLEIILLGASVRDSDNENFFMPKIDGNSNFNMDRISDAEIMAGRSLSGAYSHDDMAAKILSIKSMIHSHRPQLMMDALFKPQETVNDKYRYARYYD